MLVYAVRRLLWTFPVLWLVATLTFVLMHLAPGDPWNMLTRPESFIQSGRTISEPTVPGLRQKFLQENGLDRPLIVQYLVYLKSAVMLDFPDPIRHPGMTVSEVIRERLPYTLVIGLGSFLLALLLGVPAGLVAALRNGRWTDYVIRATLTTCYAVPNFVIAVFLLMLFAAYLGWVPVIWTDWRSFILPVISLALGPAAFLGRLTRASVLDVAGRDYVRTARAKGLSSSTVSVHHILRNAVLPVVTLLGSGLSTAVAGSVIIENIFGVHGMGYQYYQSILSRDYPMIMGTTECYALVIVLGNLLADLAHGTLEPRIRVAP
ncbi:MAG: ABC transporter permease [Chloroflexota bacterium]|nr:ABC transporter permease [Chloroflexota bacterium]